MPSQTRFRWFTRETGVIFFFSCATGELLRYYWWMRQMLLFYLAGGRITQCSSSQCSLYFEYTVQYCTKQPTVELCWIAALQYSLWATQHHPTSRLEPKDATTLDSSLLSSLGASNSVEEIDDDIPRIVWLASFPNSGASFFRLSVSFF